MPRREPGDVARLLRRRPAAQDFLFQLLLCLTNGPGPEGKHLRCWLLSLFAIDLVHLRAVDQFRFGLDWIGLVLAGLGWFRLGWIGMVWVGLDWVGLGWAGLEWFGLGWIGLV